MYQFCYFLQFSYYNLELTRQCDIFVLFFNLLINRVNITYIYKEVPSCSWSYVSWIYNYLCNQCLSPLIVVSSNHVHGEVYSIQHYVIKVSDLRQVAGFLRVLRFPPPIKQIATIRYNWNIVESGIKHHKPKQNIYKNNKISIDSTDIKVHVIIMIYTFVSCTSFYFTCGQLKFITNLIETYYLTHISDLYTCICRTK